MVSLITSLLGGLVTGEARNAARQATRAAVFYVLMAVCIAIGLGFLIGAGYIETAHRLGDRNAALAFGGGFIGLAVILYIAYRIVSRANARKARRKRSDEMTAVATAAAVAILPALLKGKGAIGLLAAPAALMAYAIYRENTRPRRRRPAQENDDHPAA